MKKGFTLVELLAVVLMIAILTSIAVPQYKRSVRRAEAMEGLSNLRSLFDAARRAKVAGSIAPQDLTLRHLDVDFFDADNRNSSSFNSGSYKYSFLSDGVSAAKISGESDTYTFKLFYNKGGQKDVMTCNATGGSLWICKSFGELKGSEYIVE